MMPHKKTTRIRLSHDALPLGAGPVRVGNDTLCEMPSEEAQAAGFECPEAARLMEIFPGRFKFDLTNNL